MKAIAVFFTGIMLLSTYTSAQQVATEQVLVSPYQERIERTGKLAFKHTVKLSFKASGYVTKLTVDEGDLFKKGDLLASLDTAELIEDKNAKYAQLLQAKRNAKRAKSLLQQNIGSQQAVDDAETLVDTSRSAYQVAFYNLEKSQIAAPYDGVVLSRNSQLGELQAPGQQVLEVAKLKDNWVVKVALTQFEVSQIKLGQKVAVSLPYQKHFVGIVSRIPAIANTRGNLFSVDVLLPALERPKGVIAGQIAQVVIDFSTEQLVYAIPIDALIGINEQGHALVLAKDGQHYQEQSYPVYKVDGHYIYLLAENSSQPLQIVTRGWQKLRLGAK